MKKIYLSIIVLLVAISSQAQAPQAFSYQAVIRNASNALVANQLVGERISLVKDSATGTVVYSETQNVKTNANGLVSLQIGTGSVVSGSFSSINWGASNYFIKIETDPAGGNKYTINTTTQLLSVPYALYAANGGTPGPQGIQGPKGDSGARGLQGIQGIQGLKGDQGIQGIQGLTGATGLKGDSGARGLQGIQGIQGLKGDQGIQGIQGLTGATGAKGDSGARGLQGIQGIQGLKGDQGIQGIQGLTGATGAKGDSGARGLQGIQGIQGLKGDQGVQGVQGLTGATGAKGDSGVRGLQGIQGLKGDKGDQGIQGIQGLTGATGPKGDSGARGLQGIQGIQGLKGDQGIQGVQGITGATGAKGDSGVSVRSTVVTGDSLYVTLSTGKKVNAGNVRGLKGAGFQNGTALGQILYWNGNIWDTIKVGKRGQFLQLNNNNIPQWAGLTYPTIKTLPATGISLNNAVLKGVIVDGGGIGIDSVNTSFLISTVSNAPISSCKQITSFQRNADTFYVDLLSAGDSLLSNTNYYVRASGYNNQYNDASGGNTIGNEISFTSKLTIGQNYAGGIIFYLDGTGQHGLVCATTDQGCCGAEWAWDASSNATYPNYNPTPTGATGTAIGTGSANTTKIIAVLGSDGVAASLCSNYRGGGYTDWFLPSKDELNQLYQNRVDVGGFASDSYWSSSELVTIGSTLAWNQGFNASYGGSGAHKDSGCNVRAVRAF